MNVSFIVSAKQNLQLTGGRGAIVNLDLQFPPQAMLMKTMLIAAAAAADDDEDDSKC